MSGPRIAVVDYQAGNLRSVEKALQRFGADVVVTSDSGELAGADALVFPGQGANDSSMRHLKSRGLVEPIREFVRGGKPFLGVCLGLQLLFEGSDEGVEPGLGLLSGWVRRLPGGVKVPHMGWNRVDLRADHPVFDGVASGSYFYFVHSYYPDPADERLATGTTSYGVRFCSAVSWSNAAAVQFHPEKSGATGLRIYENFVRLAGGAAG